MTSQSSSATDSEEENEGEIIIFKKIFMHELLSVAICRTEALLIWRTQ
jgi:hypothetical protein